MNSVIINGFEITVNTNDTVVSDRRLGGRMYYEVTFATGKPPVVRCFHGSDGAWSWTKSVGDYDDWQIQKLVEEAADVADITVDSALWYNDEE
jgi:hypothetical protein